MAQSLRTPSAYRVYLIVSGASALFSAMVFTIGAVYRVNRAGLDPLQLVLVGTARSSGSVSSMPARC